MFLPVVVFELLNGFFILIISYLAKKLPGPPESFCMFIQYILFPGHARRVIKRTRAIIWIIDILTFYYKMLDKCI
jgi:hypothetical protein